MGLGKAYRVFERLLTLTTRVVNGVGAGLLVTMMLLISTDVFLRYAFNRPLAGSFELVEFTMALIVCLAMAHTGIKKGHVAVEFVVSRFPPRVQAVIDSFNFLVSAVLFSLICWMSVVRAERVWKSGLTSSVLYVPIFPFIIVLAFGSGLLCLVFLLHFVDSLPRTRKR